MTFSNMFAKAKKALSLLLAVETPAAKLRRVLKACYPSTSDQATESAIRSGLEHIARTGIKGSILSFGPPTGSTETLRRAIADFEESSAGNGGNYCCAHIHLDINSWSLDEARAECTPSSAAMVYVDTHSYERATKVLEFLFTHGILKNGAILCIENWIFNAGSTAKQVSDAWLECEKKYAVASIDLGHYSWCARKFSIRSYATETPQPSIDERLERYERTESDRDMCRQITMAIEHLNNAGVEGDLACFADRAADASAVWMARACTEPRRLLLDGGDVFSKRTLEICEQLLPGDRITIDYRVATTKIAFAVISLSNAELIRSLVEQLLSSSLIAGGAVLFVDCLPGRFSIDHDWQHLARKYSISYSDGGNYGLAGRKFILDSYDACPQPSQSQLLEQFERSESDKAVRRQINYSLEYAYGADVKGEIIELGTCEGRTAVWLADAATRCEQWYGHHKASELDERFVEKDLYLFDSFDGLPHAESLIDMTAPHVLAGVWQRASCKALDSGQLRDLVEKFLPGDRIKIFEGWYKESMQTLPGDVRFSVVHVDCDLYQSTIDSLGYLFARGHISEGSVILFDDWNTNRSSPHHGERKAWSEMTAQYAISYTDCGPYGWGGQKFIVHSYCPSPFSSSALLEEASNLAK